MPLHDWTRVSDEVFHSFHLLWIGALVRHLNTGRLPAGYVARGEAHVGRYHSDVLALDTASVAPGSGSFGPSPRPTATIAPVHFDMPRQRQISIFTAAEQRRVALIEIVSPGNKDSSHRARWFESKIIDCLAAGLHVTVIDVHPPTGPAPGFACAIARGLGSDAIPADGRCATSFERGPEPDAVRVYHASMSLGEPLPDVPLFLEPDRQVPLALELTYGQSVDALGPDASSL